MANPPVATKQSVANKPRYILTRNAPEVVAILATGEAYAEVARIYGCEVSSVMRFAENHKDAIAGLAAEIERQVADYAIAHIVNRVRDAQLRRDLLDAVREERAAGRTGEDTGIVARQVKWIGGKDGYEVEEYKVDTAFLAEWRANDRHVAEELGQLPKADTNVQVNVGLVGLKWADGEPA